MLSKGIIEPSSGPWASPVVLLKTKDGSTHFCIDYQKVNAVMRNDAYLLPRADDTLAEDISKCQVVCHSRSVEWQVEVEPSTSRRLHFVLQMDSTSSMSCLSVCVTLPLPSSDSWNGICRDPMDQLPCLS